jgi:predicted Na+-dependent transporter
MREANIRIPFFQLIQRLLLATVPCVVGMLISSFMPRTKALVLKVAKPVALFTLLTFIALTVVAKLYTFTLVEWKHWLFAPFLPLGGFVVGSLISYLLKFPIKQVYTIGIETGKLKFWFEKRLLFCL